MVRIAGEFGPQVVRGDDGRIEGHLVCAAGDAVARRFEIAGGGGEGAGLVGVGELDGPRWRDPVGTSGVFDPGGAFGAGTDGQVGGIAVQFGSGCAPPGDGDRRRAGAGLVGGVTAVAGGDRVGAIGNLVRGVIDRAGGSVPPGLAEFAARCARGGEFAGTVGGEGDLAVRRSALPVHGVGDGDDAVGRSADFDRRRDALDGGVGGVLFEQNLDRGRVFAACVAL